MVISGLLIKPATFINKLLYCVKDCLIDIISICSIPLSKNETIRKGFRIINKLCD